MICIHHSYCWYMTCCDWSSQAVVSFSLCFTEPWRSSVPGCHDAEAAVFSTSWAWCYPFNMDHHWFHDNTWLWNFGRPQPRVGGLSVVKPKRFADVPGPKRPGALGRPGRPGSVPPTRRSPPEIIWRSYTIHIPFIYQCSLKHAFRGIAWCPPPRDACVYAESDLRWQFHGRICSKNATRIKS